MYIVPGQAELRQLRDKVLDLAILGIILLVAHCGGEGHELVVVEHVGSDVAVVGRHQEQVLVVLVSHVDFGKVIKRVLTHAHNYQLLLELAFEGLES